MILSVIVPIYQGESTLLRSVKSIEIALERLYLRYLIDTEVILVNDGSTDKSLSMCKALKKKYKNVVVVSQKNQGVAAARNVGLNVAKGDYIAFVDADDAVEPRYFISLYSEMKSDTALVISKPFKYSSELQKTKPIVGREDKLRVINTPWDAMEDFFIKNELSAVWGKLYRKTYIQSRFNEELTILEDMCFLADYLSVCKGVIKIVPEREYIYYMKEEASISLEKFDMIKIAYSHVKEKMIEAGCKNAEALNIKYLNHVAKNYLKLSPEDQNSEKGIIVLENFRSEAKQMSKNMHLKMSETFLHLSMMTNPEIMGNIVKTGRTNMYKLNRTIR